MGDVWFLDVVIGENSGDFCGEFLLVFVSFLVLRWLGINFFVGFGVGFLCVGLLVFVVGLFGELISGLFFLVFGFFWLLFELFGFCFG